MSQENRFNTEGRKLLVLAARNLGLDKDRVAAVMKVAEGGNAVGPPPAVLLTQAQKARQLGVSRFTIRKMAKLKRLHPMELLPGLLRYRADEMPQD